jgi:hypothetical protein
MLNLYLAPRGSKAPVPNTGAVDALFSQLREAGILGPHGDEGWVPGPGVASLFHADAAESHLPAELTFDALEVGGATRARVLPDLPDVLAAQARCGGCSDLLQPYEVEDALRRLKYLPIERFQVTCPGCRATLSFKEIDFAQPVAVARWWIRIEGAGTGRVNPGLLEKMGRILGLNMTVVPEVPTELVEDWVPARRTRAR